MEKTWWKGQRAEASVSLAAIRKGFFLSKPLYDGGRYDFILDDGSSLKKVQVKYAGSPTKNGAVKVHLEKKNRNNKFTYQKGEIDLLLIFYEEYQVVLAFGPEQFHNKTAIQVRFQDAKNNSAVLWWKDYVW